MKLILAASTIAITLSPATTLLAQEMDKADQAAHSHAQVRRLPHHGDTASEYSVIADFYAAEFKILCNKAAEEVRLWAQREERQDPLVEKWPRPADSARNLCDYCVCQSNHATTLQAKYRLMADRTAAKPDLGSPGEAKASASMH